MSRALLACKHRLVPSHDMAADKLKRRREATERRVTFQVLKAASMKMVEFCE
jgi:hypothetical protein